MKGRKSPRFIIFILVIVLVGSCPVRVYASEDYKTFSQIDPRWGSHYISGAGYTVGSAGCFITSIAVCMAYANKDLRDVNTFNPAILADKMNYTSGMLHSDSCSNADSSFTKVADDDGRYSAEVATKKVKEYYEKGYYVIVMSDGAPVTRRTHFSPIVGMKDGKPVLWDVAGGAHSDWDTWANAGIVNIDIFASSKTKSYDAMGGGSSDSADEVEENSPQTEEELVELEKVLSEWDLVGMPDAGKLKENLIEIAFPDASELSLSERGDIALIGSAIRSDGLNISEKLGTLMSTLGLLCVIYGVLMFVSMLFDYANVFIEISLLRVLTLGRYRLVSKEYFETNKIVGYDTHKKYVNVTIGMCIVRCIIVITVGLLLISGILQYWVVKLFNSIGA